MLNVAGAQGLTVRFVVVPRGCGVVALAPLDTVRRGPFVLAKVVGSTSGVPLKFLSDDEEASDGLLGAIADQEWILTGDSLVANDPTVVRLGRHGAWDADALVRERDPVVVLRPGDTASASHQERAGQRGVRRITRDGGSEGLVALWVHEVGVTQPSFDLGPNPLGAAQSGRAGRSSMISAAAPAGNRWRFATASRDTARDPAKFR